MPDVHSGKSSVIGFTSTLSDYIIPNVIGVDIGCGVLAIDLGPVEFEFPAVDKFIHEKIPAGFEIRKESVPSPQLQEIMNTFDKETEIKKFLESVKQVSKKVSGKQKSSVMKSIGTLGGGNHFIELDQEDGSKNIWLTIHCGSRNFGLQVANYHQKKAKSLVGDKKGLEYLEGEHAKEYLEDMKVAQKYAKLNRRTIADQIVHEFFGLELSKLDIVESIHNYIDFEDNIIRKGAISARKGERLVIPFNMATGLIIGFGKGNEEYNCSGPHGSGRLLSRTQAKQKLKMSDFQKIMKDSNVYSTCVVNSTIDEAPFAYKDTDTILKFIEPTVEIEKRLKPIYNFKAK
ncbi:RNA-splicing ligase rtcb [Anaeramoeba ignava]|uniref:3'-phosphate/5'-hydroxy nucleic acid ligase n=1 Tax=Anaeramoeba ignava TaxID=1746090 RepID=A0A9Q0LK94_ANAIG|nr:RNA-splicing ligase rtcb [Anaeramoeba ignava]